MHQLHLPWLELTVILPLIGAVVVSRLRRAEDARRAALLCALASLLCSVAAWWDLSSLHTFEAHDGWDLLTAVFGYDPLVVDELSAPLLPLTALIFLTTMATTTRTKLARFSLPATLLSQALTLALLSCKQPWLVIVLLGLQALPPLWELRSRRRSVRVFAFHMGPMGGLLVLGQLGVDSAGAGQAPIWAVWLLTLAVLLRCGVVPVHCWLTDLFENATFGTALLFATPMAGAYAAVRLVLPVAPDGVLRTIALASLVTAVYAAGTTLVQREARRFFCYLFLSHASLVLVGLETATPVGLTGGLAVWLSVGLSLTGFGLSLRAVEGRTGRLSLAIYQGLYERVPELAVFCLLTGLASVGFPGTIGFVATELLIDGAVQIYPHVGIAVVIAAALNGIAVLQLYFRLFTGARHVSDISLRSRPLEGAAVLTLAALILLGGVIPQPGIRSRHHAAVELIHARRVSMSGGAAADALASPAVADSAAAERDTQTSQPQ